MAEQLAIVAASIAGWGTAAILGTMAVALFLLREWLKALERTEGEDNED